MVFPARLPFLAALRVIRMAPNLGDTRTLVVHPWTTTHSRLPETARRAAGVTPHTIRMSVGVESVEDLKRDLDQALKVALASGQTAAGQTAALV